MKKLNYPKTLRGKIIALTASITLMITIITVVICFFVFQSLLKKNQMQSAEFNLQLVSGRINAHMKDITEFSRWCYSSNDILNYLEDFRDKEKLAVAAKTDNSLRATALSTFRRLKEEFYNNKPSSDYITRLVISNNNSTNFLQVMPNQNVSTPFVPSILDSSDYFSLLYNSPNFVWIGFVDDPFFKGTDSNLILPIIRPVYDIFHKEKIGLVYLSISSNMITDYFSSYPLADDGSLYLSVGEHFYKLNDNQLIETTPSFTILSHITDSDLDSGTRVQLIQMEDGGQRTMLSRSLETPGLGNFQFHQILSLQQMNEQKQVYVLLILGICFIILSLGALLTISLNRVINQPVAMVKRKIDAISNGDFSQDSSIEWEHEIGDIGKGINHLSRDVVNLMEKRIDDEKQKKDLEYQILQSQINPHFLYNTLNSIKWMATIQGVTGIAEMTTALARLMKNIAKGTQALISLGEELDLVKDYFLIQQYRYGGSITIEYRIEPEDLYQCRVHRFSLQPIIENALFHGIEPKGSAGKIVVEAHKLQTTNRTDLQISITDNGIGMTPETIEKILHQEDTSKTKADFFKQVGINNVNQRIKYDFGPSYGISIESVPGNYTTAIIRIPYNTETILWEEIKSYD